jgi:hypothetical protein
VMYAVVGHAGWIAMGRRGFSREFSPSFGRGVWPAPCRVRAKKIRTCRCIRRNYADAAAVVRSNIFIILLFPYG